MYIKNSSAEVKPMRKILPYTIKPIGGAAELAVWKQEQAEKQAVWEAGKADRYERAKSRSVDMITGNRSHKTTYEEQREIMAVQAMNAKAEPKAESMFPSPVQSPKVPMITSIYNKVLTWFLTINFEPKG